MVGGILVFLPVNWSQPFKVCKYFSWQYQLRIYNVCIVLGANILVSAFTITVIALDRWQSVTNTHPSDTLTYTKVGLVITAIWAISFACKLLIYFFY